MRVHALSVFRPNETCHNLLINNKEAMVQAIENIITSYGHKNPEVQKSRNPEYVTIEFESKLLKEPKGKYIKLLKYILTFYNHLHVMHYIADPCKIMWW